MIVNDNIKYIRELAEMTQVQFTTILRIPLSSLKNYENTDVMPKVEVLNTLAKIFKISVDELVNKKITSKDINIERLKMEGIVRGRKDEDIWVDTPEIKSHSLKELQDKYAGLQDEYIAHLRKFDEIQGGFRDVLNDVNEQRNSDMKVLNTMIGEVIKRLDRFQQEFDETKKGLYTMIQQVDSEFRGRLDDIEDQFHSYSKETDKEMSKFYERLSRIDPPQKPD